MKKQSRGRRGRAHAIARRATRDVRRATRPHTRSHNQVFGMAKQVRYPVASISARGVLRALARKEVRSALSRRLGASTPQRHACAIIIDEAESFGIGAVRAKSSPSSGPIAAHMKTCLPAHVGADERQCLQTTRCNRMRNKLSTYVRDAGYIVPGMRGPSAWCVPSVRRQNARRNPVLPVLDVAAGGTARGLDQGLNLELAGR